jgi:hypothetical protein
MNLLEFLGQTMILLSTKVLNMAKEGRILAISLIAGIFNRASTAKSAECQLWLQYLRFIFTAWAFLEV